MKKNSILIAVTLCMLTSACHPNSRSIEPSIYYVPNEHLINSLPEAFPTLSPSERSHEWGKELYLGKKFAREMDLYRALTCFKSALYLIPSNQIARRLEIEYEIFLAYYIGNKYHEAIEAFERSHLIDAPESFPALNDLTVALYDSYIQVDQSARANKILNLIQQTNPETANDLLIETAIIEVDFSAINDAIEESDESGYLTQFVTDYSQQSLSVSKAQLLNAILPGAGYAYVGQEKAALTSFLINALFIAASYQLFNHGYVPAAILTTGLEMGWYFGGINGAGLAAKEYNERLYERLARDTMIENKLFPILMLEKAF